jgi:hypothetical protein
LPHLLPLKATPEALKGLREKLKAPNFREKAPTARLTSLGEAVKAPFTRLKAPSEVLKASSPVEISRSGEK